jgi:hypothetical protein
LLAVLGRGCRSTESPGLAVALVPGACCAAHNRVDPARKAEHRNGSMVTGSL